MEKLKTAKTRTDAAARLVRFSLLAVFAAGFQLASLPALSAEVPLKFTYQGNLRQNGQPATGTRSMVFRIYSSSAAALGSELWASDPAPVGFFGGLFRVALEPSLSAWQSGGLWLELQIEGNRLTPREEITAAPFAINAALHSGKRYTSADTAPASPAKGDLWINTALNALYFWNGTAWTSTAGSGASHASSHAGGALDAITGLGAHSVTGDITFNGGVSLRSEGEGVRVSTHLVVVGALNPYSGLNIGGAGYAVSLASSVLAGVYGGSRFDLAGQAGYGGDLLTISAAVAGAVRLTGADEVHAVRYYGDGSGLTGIGGGSALADNLGNHIATTDLKLESYQLTGSGPVTMSSFTATGPGLRAAALRLADTVTVSSESSAALGAGVRVSSNVYIVGFSSSARYYGDGSALTGLTAVADNLGNHTATMDLNMAANQITGAGAATMSSFTATGIGVEGAQLRLAPGVAVSSESSGALGAGVRVSSNVYVTGFSSAAAYYGDGSALTGLAAMSDGLGDHTATTDLKMGGNQLTGFGAMTMSSFTATGIGLEGARLLLAGGVAISSEASGALGGGVRVSSNVYIVGIASATRYYGDGSALTGIVMAGDNLGDHTAVMDIRMGAHQVTGAGAVTLSSFTATGIGAEGARLLLAEAVAISSESSPALGGGVRVSSNVYVVGFTSATKYYGDGSALSGLDALQDNLGDHTATTELHIGSNQVSGLGAATMSSFTATGIGAEGARLLLAPGVAVSSEASAALGTGLRVSSNVYVVGFTSATRYYGDGSALTGLTGLSDSLGNHTAAADLNLGANRLFGQGAMTMSSFTATGAGLSGAQLRLGPSVIVSSESSAALGGGVRVSTNVYIMGVSSAARYYGDGSTLSGMSALQDNLGNHTAVTDLKMGVHQLTGAGSATMSSFTATGIGLSGAQLRLGPSVVVSSESSGALGGGVRVSSNIYIVGFASATKYYGDGSGLTGLTAMADNLGDHNATTDLNLNNFDIINAGGLDVTGAAGLQLAGAAEANKYLRGNNSQFVASAIQVADLPATAAAPYVLDAGDTMTGQLTINGATLTVTGAEGLRTPRRSFGDGLSFSSTTDGGSGIAVNGDLYTPGLLVTAYGELQTRGAGRGSAVGSARGVGAVDLQVKRSVAGAAATGGYSVLSGGQENTASGDSSVVSGGSGNTAASQHAVVGGGTGNMASGTASTVPGGLSNTAGGDYSFAAGRGNSATGEYAFAAGYNAQSSAAGAFTWADSQGTPLENFNTDRVRFKARGGFMVSGSTAAPTAMTGSINRGLVVTGGGLVGVAKYNPAAALDVAAAGDTPADMVAVWRNSAGNIVSSVSASGVITAAKFVGDGSGLSALPARIYATAALTGTVNDYIQIGSFNSPSGMHNLYVSVTVTLPAFGFSVARQYAIPIYRNMIGSGWRVVLPISNTGPSYEGNDFMLEVSVTGTITILRLRRTSGNTPGTAVISVEQVGPADDVFTPSSQVGNTASQYPLLPVAVISQTGGMVGAGTAAPRSRFDVLDGSVTTRGTGAGLVLENASRVITPVFSAALGGGVRVSTNVYIVGIASAAAFLGDGSALTGITLDNMGNHTAEQMLDLRGNAVMNIASAAITGANVTGANPLLRIAGSTLVVLNNGNVGLGTEAPAARLHLADPIAQPSAGEAVGAGQLRLDNAAASLAEAGGIEFKNTGAAGGSGNKIQAINSGGSQLLFAGRQAGGAWTEHLRIGPGGNVGIGRPSAGSRLDVYSTGNTFVAIGGGGDSGFSFTNTTGAQTWKTYTADNGYYRVDRASGGGELSIDLSGRTGLGVNNPSTALDVNGAVTARSESAGALAFRAVGRVSDDLAWAPLTFRNDNTTPMGGMAYTPSSVSLSTGSAAAEVVMTVISANGNVGIGTKDPAARLDVGGTGAFIMPIGTTLERPAAPVPGMVRLNSDTGSLEYYYNGEWIVFGTWL